jgi:hypothetical protein
MSTTENNRDPFAFAGYEGDGDGDAEILAMFKQWREGMQEITGKRPSEETDDEYNAAHGVVMGIAEQICDAPVYGPIGLAIKSFMFAYEVNLYDEFAEDGCGDRVCAIGRLNPDGDNYGCRSDPKTGEYKNFAELVLLQRAMRGLLDTASRFVPDLAPLVAEVRNWPLTLPSDKNHPEAPAAEYEAGKAEVNKADLIAQVIAAGDGVFQAALTELTGQSCTRTLASRSGLTSPRHPYSPRSAANRAGVFFCVVVGWQRRAWRDIQAAHMLPPAGVGLMCRPTPASLRPTK